MYVGFKGFFAAPKPFLIKNFGGKNTDIGFEGMLKEPTESPRTDQNRSNTQN